MRRQVIKDKHFDSNVVIISCAKKQGKASEKPLTWYSKPGSPNHGPWAKSGPKRHFASTEKLMNLGKTC